MEMNEIESAINNLTIWRINNKNNNKIKQKPPKQGKTAQILNIFTG